MLINAVKAYYNICIFCKNGLKELLNIWLLYRCMIILRDNIEYCKYLYIRIVFVVLPFIDADVN